MNGLIKEYRRYALHKFGVAHLTTILEGVSRANLCFRVMTFTSFISMKCCCLNSAVTAPEKYKHRYFDVFINISIQIYKTLPWKDNPLPLNAVKT